MTDKLLNFKYFNIEVAYGTDVLIPENFPPNSGYFDVTIFEEINVDESRNNDEL